MVDKEDCGREKNASPTEDMTPNLHNLQMLLYWKMSLCISD